MTLAPKNLELCVASGASLDVRSFSVTERLSALFQVEIVALSDNPSVSFDETVGHPAHFTLNSGTHGKTWSGLCRHLEQTRVEPSGLSTYRVLIAPTLWLLTQRKNYRIFQQLSELDIALQILKEWAIEPDVRLDRAAYKTREYRVQYAESDFAFFSRMLEEAGITYFFESLDEATKLVISDAPQGNPRRSLPLPFVDDTSLVQLVQTEFVTKVRLAQEVRPGKYTLRDYDFRLAPSYPLMASASAGKGVEERLESYQYSPGAFLFGAEQGEPTPVADDKGMSRSDEKEGAFLAQKRLSAAREGTRTCVFETNAHDLAPGAVVRVVGHPHEALREAEPLLIVASSIQGTNSGEWTHSCEARGAEAPFRPEMTTPKPRIHGVESATVVGPGNEEIHTDEFGRVRVYFPWDRRSRMDDDSSCWIHVSQPWAGSGYGGMNIPRVGQEVLVDFLGGDPDRPVIVGRVYTNLQKVPYKLPANKTQSGWKSSSTNGTGSYNEIMFEDAAGAELVRVQSARDMTCTVGLNRTSTIGSVDSTSVGERFQVAVAPIRSDPDEDGEKTAFIMADKKIMISTGAGATITMDGDAITLEATTIVLKAKGSLVGTSGDQTNIDGKNLLALQSTGGDVVIQGAPMVHINP